MEISILRDTEYVSSSGIVDDTEAYDNSVNRTFKQGELLQSGNGIYTRTGADFLADVYNLSNEASYTLNQIIFKDNLLKYVSAVAGITAVQPNDYVPAPPENLGFGSWGHRYAKLGTLNTSTNTWSKAASSEVTHSFRLDGTVWKYKIYKPISNLEWSTEIYSNVFPENYILWSDNNNQIITRYKGNIIYTGTAGSISPGQIFTANEGGNTFRFKVGTLRDTYTGTYGSSYFYGISVEQLVNNDQEYEVPVTMLNSSQLDVLEEKAYCVDSAACSTMWLPKTVIRIGNDLYIRTDTNDVQEESVATAPTFITIETLDQISWGWTYTEPTKVFAPLDGKKYTYVEAASPLEYTVKGANGFDTVAINGLIADTVEVTFLPDDGSDPIDMISVTPRTARDQDRRLPGYNTTTIVYAPRDITGNVHLKFISSGSIRIGGITLGMNVNAGFTNLVFTNKFVDYSPYEKDQWGNILYVPGVKTNLYSGTVDIPVLNYDMINRLMMSIGGETVILNGSDNANNAPIDSSNYFASTAVVGRIRGFALKTKLRKTKLAQMATYTFEIEEDV